MGKSAAATKNSIAKPARDIDRTRKLILDAAVAEFARVGMQGARVDTVARKAGVNKAMIYYIFKSKDELYLAALEALFEEKTKGVDPPPDNSEVLELLSDYFDAFAKNPEIVRMIMHDVAGGAEALRTLKRRRPDLFEPYVMVSDLLESRMKEGTLRPIDPDKAVALIILVFVSLIGILPHADLMREKNTPEYDSLNNVDEWKSFLAQIVMRVVK